STAPTLEPHVQDAARTAPARVRALKLVSGCASGGLGESVEWLHSETLCLGEREIEQLVRIVRVGPSGALLEHPGVPIARTRRERVRAEAFLELDRGFEMRSGVVESAECGLELSEGAGRCACAGHAAVADEQLLVVGREQLVQARGEGRIAE